MTITEQARVARRFTLELTGSEVQLMRWALGKTSEDSRKQAGFPDIGAIMFQQLRKLDL